jgi:hypothetical protein
VRGDLRTLHPVGRNSATTTVQAAVELENRIPEIRQQEIIMRQAVDAIFEGQTCPGIANDPAAKLRPIEQEVTRLEKEYIQGFDGATAVGDFAGIACDAVILATCVASTP